MYVQNCFILRMLQGIVSCLIECMCKNILYYECFKESHHDEDKL